MKEQYVGDLNDYREYALLRALAAGEVNRIAVCWMLTPPDDRNDGNKRAYLDQPEKHRPFDPTLFDVLRGVEDGPGVARLLTIENSGIIPGATYFNEELSREMSERASWRAAGWPRPVPIWCSSTPTTASRWSRRPRAAPVPSATCPSTRPPLSMPPAFAADLPALRSNSILRPHDRHCGP